MSETKVVLELTALDLSVLTGCLSWAHEAATETAIKQQIVGLRQRCLDGLSALNNESKTPDMEVNDGKESK